VTHKGGSLGEPKRIALAAGGTGGHVYPAMAVLSALLERDPAPQVEFFGRKKGLEFELLRSLPVRYLGLSIVGIPRKFSHRLVTGPLLALGAFVKCLWAFISRRPHLVVGFGSYVAAPVVLAALCLGIPTIIHEQNSVPGLANRLLAPWVSRVLATDPDTAGLFRNRATVAVGIPLRKHAVGAGPAFEEFGLDTGKNTLLIFGGSQGARKIGQVAVEALRRVHEQLPDWQTLLISGKGNYENLRKEQLPSQVILKDYVENMGAAYAMTTLAVARAGAVSLAELTANGIPSILIPLPSATGDHQTKNAKALEAKGAAVVIEDSKLTAQSLGEVILSLARNAQRLPAMAKAAANCAHSNATETFLAQIDELLQ
jgi:UDP-N-acetylglucosamine--N-acetylmuramyl-(pentapeptide) pyrophosphoryl-undecaprenol N-acetylglucosamine transferase